MNKIYNYNDASTLLLNAYLKVLRVDLTHDTFSELKVDDEEIDEEHGYASTISKWLNGFALTGNVYQDDIEKYLKFTNLDNLRNEFKSGKDSIHIRYRRKNHHGFRYARMTLRKSAEYQDDNQIVLLYIEDIHDDIMAARELSVQKNITAALVDMYFTCLYVDLNDNSYSRVYVNKDFEEFVPEKGNMQSIMNAYMKKLVVPNDSKLFSDNFSVKTIVEKLSKQNSYDYEYWAHIDNKKIWCRICAILVDKENDRPRHILIAMQDVTAQAESIANTNAILKDAFSAAVAANSAKSEFMSRMSHDIRTPLNGIIGMTAIAAGYIDNKEKVSDCLTKITGASKHLLLLINDILDLSKIESGKVTLTDASFNLPTLIDELLDMVHNQIEEHHHELEVYVDNIQHEDVIGDNVRLQQVFLNLVSNSIKYTKDGGKIKIRLSEKPSGSLNLGLYQFVVEDNGFGMSEEFQKKLFDPFERAEDERISKIQGTGLGMTISKNIINMMGGDIEVESKENVGTKFTVTFKIKLQNKDTLPISELVNLPVLVVDDEIEICESTCLTLNELGMNGSYSLSGKEAVEKVTLAHKNNNDFFACLIDWKMPEMDGLETTRRIRKAVGNDVPIIIVTGYEWSDIEEDARKAGADGFIAKPLFKSRLHAAFTEIPKANKFKDNKTVLDDYSTIDFTTKRILLVEDNELNREIATDLISMTGAKVESAENGKIACEMFASHDENYYDLIFMDITMPVMNGYEATKIIRSTDKKYSKRIPIIALTANAFVEDITTAHKVGMNEHISKPIDTDKLLSVMKLYLR